MGRPKMSSSFSQSIATVELPALGGTLRFGTPAERNTYVEDASTDADTGGIHTMARDDNQITSAVKALSSGMAEMSAEHLDDGLVAGATALTDLDNVINDLHAARKYLQAEPERLGHPHARYATWAKAAQAPAKGIGDSRVKGRN